MSTTTDSRAAGRLRPTAAGGLLIVLASAATSLLAAGSLPERVRVRWTVDPSYHVGPEYAPALVVLIAAPVAVATLYAASRWFRGWLQRTEPGFEDVSVVYEAAVLGLLATLVLVQVALVAANLLG